jgi:hypothetical protein
MISSLLRPAFPNNQRIKPRALSALQFLNMVYRWAADALTGIIVCAVSADSADQSCHGLKYRLTGYLTARTIARTLT